jgi:hypothetical protein
MTLKNIRAVHTNHKLQNNRCRMKDKMLLKLPHALFTIFNSSQARNQSINAKPKDLREINFDITPKMIRMAPSFSTVSCRSEEVDNLIHYQ